MSHHIFGSDIKEETDTTMTFLLILTDIILSRNIWVLRDYIGEVISDII